MTEDNKCVAQNINTLGNYECKFTGNPAEGPAVKGIETTAGQVKYVYFKCQDHSQKKNYDNEALRLTVHGSNLLQIDSITTEPRTDNGEIKISTIIPIKLKLTTKDGAKQDGSAECSYQVYNKDHTLTPGINPNTLVGMTQFLNTNGSYHEQIFTNLPTGENKFFTGCHDIAGNTAFDNITIQLNQDIEAPRIIRTYLDTSLTPPIFKIEVNEDATCKDSNIPISDYANEGNIMTKEGNVQITTTPGNNFYYVLCKDNYGNLMTQPIQVQIA